MEEAENTVQKHVNNFCKILPIHVDKWRTILESTSKPAETLSNYAEQLRHIEKAELTHIENFKILQQTLSYKIFIEIECEIAVLKDHIATLNKVNQDLKNKLTLLEQSTVDLNWESDSLLLRGSAVQPPLSKILQGGLQFWLYFADAMKSINENMKSFDIRKQKSMSNLEKCLKINLDNSIVMYFLAVTQYVINENSIT